LLTCKQFLAELSDFLDESLGREERKQIEEHINECPNCWVIADTTRKTIEVYRCSQPVPLPGDLKSRLMKALERKVASRRAGVEPAREKH
jgi:anti-sigma factor (TIGR02949 family)